MNPEQPIPLVIAANRDEYYNREGEPAELRSGDPYDFVAPRDPRGGGTWIGLNDHGLFTALTNQPEEGVNAPKSRGRIVRDLLASTKNIEQASDYLDNLNAGNYAPYSLIVITPEGIISQSLDKNQTTSVEQHDGGDFVLSSERGFEMVETGEWDRFPWRTDSGRDDPDKLRGRLQSFCKQTDSFRHRDAVCRSGEKFGTLSSSITILDRSRPELFLDFASGPPCDTAYKSISVPDSFKSSIFSQW